MADLAWFRLSSVHRLAFETTSAPRKREIKHFGTFSVHVGLMILELASS